MKINLKPRDRVVHIKRGTFGQVIEVFGDGDCWVEFDNGMKGCYPRRALKKMKFQNLEAI
jgi:hypothetical protein